MKHLKKVEKKLKKEMFDLRMAYWHVGMFLSINNLNH